MSEWEFYEGAVFDKLMFTLLDGFQVPRSGIDAYTVLWLLRIDYKAEALFAVEIISRVVPEFELKSLTLESHVE